MRIVYPCKTCRDPEGFPCEHWIYVHGEVIETYDKETDTLLIDKVAAAEAAVGAKSKADTTNPKDLLGAKKVSFTSVPPIAIAHEAVAMMDGARKYGPYNWRDKKVQARIYVDAAIRHITSWFEGEEYATDSRVHHLGHARACLGILLDAITTGNLVDDRPVKPETTAQYVKAMDGINETIKRKSQ